MIQAHLLFLSGMDIAAIAAVALLLFGGKKIPELAKGLGEGIRHFKDASEGKTDDAAKKESNTDKK